MYARCSDPLHHRLGLCAFRLSMLNDSIEPSSRLPLFVVHFQVRHTARSPGRSVHIAGQEALDQVSSGPAASLQRQ